MTVSLKAVHCISSGKKVFPQTFPSELSRVISKSKDLSFCKYIKIIFRAQNNHSRKTHTFECCKDRTLPKLRSSLLKDHQTQQKNFMIPSSSDPSKVKLKCTLPLIYFVLRDPEFFFFFSFAIMIQKKSKHYRQYINVGRDIATAKKPITAGPEMKYIKKRKGKNTLHAAHYWYV